MGKTLYVKTENESLEYEFSFSNFWHVVFRDCYGYVSEMLTPHELETILWNLEDANGVDEYGDSADEFVPVIKEPISFGKIMNKIHKKFADTPEQYMCYAGGYDGSEYDLPAIELYGRDFVAIEKCCMRASKDGCGIVLFGYY